jgi:hypothetical protein
MLINSVFGSRSRKMAIERHRRRSLETAPFGPARKARTASAGGRDDLVRAGVHENLPADHWAVCCGNALVVPILSSG